MRSCADKILSRSNKILSRSNNILSRRNKLKNKTRMSLPGFRKFSLTKWSFFAMKCTHKSEVYFSVEIIEFSIYNIPQNY